MASEKREIMDKKLLDNIFLYGCNKYVPDRVIYNKNKKRIQKATLIYNTKTDCQHCGASEIEWHHVGPVGFRISNWPSHTFDELKQELDKCICLCRRCHAEVHREESRDRAKRQWAEVRAANPEARNVGDVSRPNR